MKNLLPLAILFVIFLLYYLFRGLKKYRLQTKNSPSHLSIPESWQRIIVNGEDCEVFYREYYEEKEIDESPTIRKLLDSIKTDNTAKKIGLSVVVYTHKFPDGEVFTFKSKPLKSDDVSVRYMLMNLKTVSLFVDPLDRNNYLFKI